MPTSTHDLWVRRFRPSPASSTELVCFPHAGGSAAFWFPLASRLASTVDVLAVQYPGRQDRYREKPVDDLHRLADLIADALSGESTRPRAFLGHSMGASLAYEVAVRLSGSPGGGGPVAVFISGRRAPSRTRSADEVLCDDQALIDRLRALGGTGGAMLEDQEMLRLILPVVRADYRAIGSYQGTPGAALSVPVVALAGDADTEASVADVEAWRQHTTGSFELRVLPGGHFFVREQLPVVADLVAQLLPRYAAAAAAAAAAAPENGGRA
ncbi:thioesterase II family protein [Streptacidiphilus sp. EB103A]|uniref:thioesterase II family protein n=1 Tax=Streptacidiphilus sp. EB103A TaxID=3156275 RepID=UPI003516CC94